MHLDSLAVHAVPPAAEGAVVPPIHLASTFEQPTDGASAEFAYQRGGNPTRAQLESVLAALEGGEHGFAFATGMAATTAAFSLLRAGDEVLICSSVYGGTYRFVDSFFPRQGLSARWVEDLNELSDDDFDGSVRMVFVETPANPTMRVVDIARVAEIAHRHGALVVVDNTFMTPYLQNPLGLGADVIVHSATKYLAGHSDLLAGAAVTGSAEIAAELALAQKAQGGVLDPIGSYRLIQDIKTLGLRMQRSQDTTDRLRELLAGHEAVARVYWPGWFSAQETAIQERQARGHGAVLSIDLAPGYDSRAFIGALELFSYAVSLGGVESLVCHPATMTHEAMSPAARRLAGIGDGMVRLSIGIEHGDDVLADVSQALAAAKH